MLAQHIHMLVRGRLHIRFGPMHGTVHFVIILKQFRKMSVRLFERAHVVRAFGEFFCQFVGCVAHVSSGMSGAPGPFTDRAPPNLTRLPQIALTQINWDQSVTRTQNPRASKTLPKRHQTLYARTI